jgi:pimeloyl-ACP methyl ester carboxylesterase
VTQSTTESSPKKGYAPVNGLQLYYETHGSGEPLILLHGGAGATGMWTEIMPTLSRGRQVIAVDLQAHGRTADINRPLRYELMANDIAALISYLKLGKADLMGYSLGGGVALRTAIQHHELVKKLVLVSAPFARDGWYPEIREAMSHSVENIEPMKQTPMYEMYSRIAPRPEDWSVMFTKLGDLLSRDYNWSNEVQEIISPTMLVVGDADSVRTSHAVEFFELLGGGKTDAGWDGSKMSKAKLAILPGITHYNIFASQLLASIVSSFLEPRTDQRTA